MSERRTLDLGGVLTIGVLGAGDREVARLRRQLGPLPDIEGHPSDLVIEFVDRLPTAGPLVALGKDAAYDDDGLIIRRGRRQTDVRIRVPLDQLGTRPLTIVAERGAPSIPSLIPLVGLTALAAGHVPVHASATPPSGTVATAGLTNDVSL